MSSDNKSLNFKLVIALDRDKEGVMVYQCEKYPRISATITTPRPFSAMNQNKPKRYFQVDDGPTEYPTLKEALAVIGEKL